MRFNQLIGLLLAGWGLCLAACQPYVDPDVDLGAPPTAAIEFSVLADDPNRVAVQDMSSDAFIRNWSFGNGSFSTKATDTAYYPFAGEYIITLAVSGKGGSSSKEQVVTITQDDPGSCSDSTLVFLAGGCAPGDSSVWIFSNVSGAITVGPTELATDWFTSTADGLVVEQYNDSWVFYIADKRFQYFNEGLTVDPFNGYEALPYETPADLTWALSPGTGYEGADQIILPAGTFIGTRDSGPIYDIVSISADEMVLLAPVIGSDGAPTAGWFTFYLVRQ